MDVCRKKYMNLVENGCKNLLQSTGIQSIYAIVVLPTGYTIFLLTWDSFQDISGHRNKHE